MGSKWLLPGGSRTPSRACPNSRELQKASVFAKHTGTSPAPVRVHGGGGGGTVLVYWVLVQTTPGSHQQGEPLMINSGPGP